jgi:hypothetical protein
MSSTVEAIFANVPPGCADIRLGVRVWYPGTAGAPMYILTDYLYYGGDRTRVRFVDRRDQRRCKQAELTAVLEQHGWTQGQPTRRNTTEMVYTFTPSRGQDSFGLHSQTAEVAEKRHQQRVFEQLAAAI